jgi:hypothetical protein
MKWKSKSDKRQDYCDHKAIKENEMMIRKRSKANVWLLGSNQRQRYDDQKAIKAKGIRIRI